MSKLKYSLYLNKTSKDFSERGFETILALFLSTGSLFLLFLFPVAGIALMVFAYGFLCVGTKRYLIGIVRDETLAIETIFSKIKICVKAFCLKIATTLITMLWSLVFVIPGIVTALNYSMSSFVMADENLDALECMVKSKKLVYGHRGELCVLYLSYLFVILAVLCICVGLGCAMRAYFSLPYWIPIVSMGLLALFVLAVFVIPYFELMFAEVYEVLKKNENLKNEVSEISKPKRKYTKKSIA